MPTFRVSSPDTLASLERAIHAPVREAIRIPGPRGSTFRVWALDGTCWTVVPRASRLLKKVLGLTFRRPVRTTAFDR